MIIEKILSDTDIGINTHQSGIYVPKNSEILSFFPKLTSKKLNPRARMIFYDIYGEEWIFNFIYYNNKFHGGTRNEFRVTGISKFIRSRALKSNDIIKLQKKNNNFFIHYKKSSIKVKRYTGHYDWKIVEYFNVNI